MFTNGYWARYKLQPAHVPRQKVNASLSIVMAEATAKAIVNKAGKKAANKAGKKAAKKTASTATHIKAKTAAKAYVSSFAQAFSLHWPAAGAY